MWFETPDQRRERMEKGEAYGVYEQAAERLERERVAARDAAIREQIASVRVRSVLTQSGRAPSLLEQFQAKRREELREKSSSGRGERAGAEHHAGERNHSDREHHSQRHTHRHSHREHRYRRHRSDREREQHRTHHRGSSERRHEHRHRDLRERSPPPRKTRAQREQEDRDAYGEFMPLRFDKDKVLGAGSRLMDERARARTIADAAELGSRFATGKSGSFL